MTPHDALQRAVREVEAHASAAGWDRPAQLFALVETSALLADEPGLAETLGIPADAEGLTPIEQEPLDSGQELEDVLARIVWPPAVTGCAAVVERLVLPPGAEDEVPADPELASRYAAEHPDRQDVRIVAGATRDGGTYCALRMRAHDDDDAVMTGEDLVPALVELVAATLDDDQAGPEAAQDPR